MIKVTHKYEFSNFEDELADHLSVLVDPDTICPIYNVSHSLSLGILKQWCIEFIESYGCDFASAVDQFQKLEYVRITL